MKRKLQSSGVFKRVLSLTIALVMVLGMLPSFAMAADGTTLYLKPNANWLVDSARFAVYYWDNSGDAWTSMTDADGDGYYEAVIPAGYTNIIFCRMNPSTTANNWDNKWNQTADLTVPTDGTNCYTVKDGTWDSGGGTWSVYTPAGQEPAETEPAPAGTYYVAGDAALCGSSWSNNDAANQMTWNGTTGCFEKVYTGVAEGTYNLKVTDGTWDNCWGDGGNNYTFVVSAVCDVTVRFDPDTKTVSVTGDSVGKETGLDITSIHAVGNGSGNWMGSVSWDPTQNEMTEVSELVYEITFKNVEASGSYQFKFAANGQWTHSWGGGGAEGEAVYNGQDITLAVTETSDVTLQLDLSGYDHSTKLGATYSVTMTPAEGGTTEPDPEEPSEPEIPEGDTAVTLHFMKPDGWGNGINAYLWTTTGAVAGYSDYNSWPGKAVSDTDGDGWYDLVVVTDSPFYFIFNDGGNQTADLYTGEVTGDLELWVVGNNVSTEKPGYNVTIHFQKPDGWGTGINAYVWDANGNQLMGSWPGTAVAENGSNAGWYDLSIEMEDNTGFNFIFNDGSNQTADLATGTLSFNTELWVYADQSISTSAPQGWGDPNRKVYVPGTFPGPSWDASSNQMTYDEELGLYVYTFEDVPAANYEFKIAINGSWDENYGAGGERDGSNIAVTVPQTMDVIVYYNDNTHNAVTNVTYVFADITLSGTGIADGTKLSDSGLTGIYSVTVSMKAGTYSDVKLTMDGKDYEFAEFTLEQDKDVTFYMDPVTGIYYHNGSDVPVDTGSIYYNSQDEAYKAPFGAVAQGEEVTFAIDTGDDITSAVLVIKGVASYPMEKDETTGKWVATASVANLGEYDYYFVMSNGSAVAVYGDDDGYYGEGTVTDLTGVMPYDLVVYEAGYETPDWMKNAVIYQIFPDRFFDGDETNNQAQTWARGSVNYEYITDWYTLPENPEQEAMLDEETYLATGAHYGDGEWSNEIYGGDLQGIIQRIDYLKALGVNVIYLNPVFWSISNHRYDAVSYTEIDPILGTLGDFEELVAVAEANDMHIILDGVFNHVSDDSVYFDRYYKFLPDAAEKYDGKIGAYPYWAYVYDYMAEEGVAQAEAEDAAKSYFGENYGITDYSYTEWFAVSSEPMAGAVDSIGLRAGKTVYSYEGWWGYDSMPVIYSTNGSEYQTGNWAEEIISGENSVNAYWISKGMDGWRLDVANEVSDETWQNFRDSVKALDSEAVIIGEIWDDATKYLMGDMYDSVMNYQFRNAVTSYAMGTSAEQTTKAMEKIRERYPEEAFYAMMNLVGSHDTTRILSYLDGIGDDRSDKSLEAAFPTYETTSQLAKDRQHLVSFLQFTYAGAPTIYYGDEIGMVGSDDPDDRRAFEWGMGNEELVTWYARLAAIREAYPALRTGSVQVMETGSASLMGFVRADETNSLTVIANNASSAKTIALEGAWVDLVSGETFEGTVTVPALSGVILVTEAEAKEITVDTEGLAPAYDPAYIVAERCDGENHTYTAEVTEPTCTEAGYTTYTCSCGDSYVADEVGALGHSYVDGVCEHCGEADPDYVDPTDPTDPEPTAPTDPEPTDPSEPEESVPATPVKPSKPNLGSIFDKIKEWFSGWFEDEPEEPEETEPSVPEETEPEETEPEETEPEETVPSTPVKPGWGGWFSWFWKFW